MKSAIEIAMEKSEGSLGGEVELTQGQKERIARERSIGAARVAETKILFADKLNRPEAIRPDSPEADPLEALARAIAKIEEETERKIAAIRAET